MGRSKVRGRCRPTRSLCSCRKPMASADHCSFTTGGIGRFRPMPGATPAIGAVGRFEAVVEERIETVSAEDRLKDVLAAIRRSHPYEEPAIDIYPLAAVE